MVAKLWSRISSLIQVGTFQFLERQVDFGGFSNKKKKSTRKVNISRKKKRCLFCFGCDAAQLLVMHYLSKLCWIILNLLFRSTKTNFKVSCWERWDDVLNWNRKLKAAGSWSLRLEPFFVLNADSSAFFTKYGVHLSSLSFLGVIYQRYFWQLRCQPKYLATWAPISGSCFAAKLWTVETQLILCYYS